MNTSRSFVIFAVFIIAVSALPEPGRLRDYDAGEFEVPAALQSRGPTPEDDFTGSNEAYRKFIKFKFNLIIIWFQ